MTQEYITHSAEETEAVGRTIASQLHGCRVLALQGGLGAGKTTLTRGIAQGLGCTLAATSPTYTLVNEYPGRRPVYHFDLYRLLGEDDLYDIGWEDYLSSGALCVVEWSERAPGAMPPDTARITLALPDEHTRRITLTLPERLGKDVPSC